MKKRTPVQSETPTQKPDPARRASLRFLIRFGCSFALLMLAHVWARPYTSYFLLAKMNAGVAAAIIHLITPAQAVVASGQDLVSGPFRLTIARGCDGIDGILLITAAMLAFPARARDRATGILLGCTLMYALNLVRIVSLYYMARYTPALFDAAHLYLWQAIIILCAFGIFAQWTHRVQRAQRPRHGEAETA